MSKTRRASCLLNGLGYAMPDQVRILKHQIIPGTGSYEVRFAAVRPSVFFYFEDIPSRRLRPDILTREQALEQAKAFARAERDNTT